MAKKRRQYTDLEIATALATLTANGGNIKQTARDLSVPVATIRKWRDNIPIKHPELANSAPGVSPECPPKKEHIGQLTGQLISELSGAFKTAIYEMTLMLVPAAKIAKEKGHVSQISTAIGTIYDKNQLLEGNPTDITKIKYEEMNDDELDIHLQVVRERQHQLSLVERDGTSHPVSEDEPLQRQTG